MTNITKPGIRELSIDEMTFMAGGFSFTEAQISENIDAIISDGFSRLPPDEGVATATVRVSVSNEALSDGSSVASVSNSDDQTPASATLPSIANFVDEISVRPFTLNAGGRL